MTFDDFIATIEQNIQIGFDIEPSDEYVAYLLDLVPELLSERHVFRFQRKQLAGINGRWLKTVLVAGITQSDSIELAVDWAALAKDTLSNPETSDIYLFLVNTAALPISTEECLTIESSELLCRRFVLRPNETIADFVQRTFIEKTKVADPVDLAADPLLKAFREVSKQYPWFDQHEQLRWRQAFNSGLSGYDFFQTILDNSYTTE
jgi:hypothetical protein